MTAKKENGPIQLPNTLEECEALRDQLDADATRIKLQIDKAKGNAAQHGKYSDSNWYSRATAALRYMNKDRQRLQEHMARLRSRAGVMASKNYDQILIYTLREMVGESLFAKAVTITQRRRDESDQL